MPAYDYKCELCNQIFEFEHPMQDTMDWNPCPECKIDEAYLHKVFRPAATHFKGQGWGKTYRVHTPKGE